MSTDIPSDEEVRRVLQAIQKRIGDWPNGVAGWHEVRDDLLESGVMDRQRVDHVRRFCEASRFVETPPGGAAMDIRLTPAGLEYLAPAPKPRPRMGFRPPDDT